MVRGSRTPRSQPGRAGGPLPVSGPDLPAARVGHPSPEASERKLTLGLRALALLAMPAAASG